MNTNIQELKNPPWLAELLLVLMANHHKHMSTLDLLQSGILSPAAGIATLKDRGFLIHTIYQSITDSSGRTRKRIACYKIIEGVVV